MEDSQFSNISANGRLPVNPKDALGDKKPMAAYVSPFANLHECFAMMDGYYKYGPWNWRDIAVRASVYLNAVRRHLDAWQEGEEYAPDSTAHHLGHARACLGLLIDAMETGNLIDDRKKTGNRYTELTNELSNKIAKKKPEWLEKQAEREAKEAKSANTVQNI